MAVAAFEWNDYEVPVHPVTRAAARLAAETSAPPEMVTLSIPNLNAFPSPLQKAEILLQSAAEIEHMLMVQYLYGAYSLKTFQDVTDPAQQAVLLDTSEDAWPQMLLGIAREEMGHLMTVQNLLLLLGRAPNFEREDFPPQKEMYPFALHLEPLTQVSLAKYVVAESPADATGIDVPIELAKASEGGPINRVGTIYGLLGLIFATKDQVEPGASGDAQWDAWVRRLNVAALRQNPDADAWHLQDADFHATSVEHQADPSHWQVGHLRVHKAPDRAAAVEALRDVGEQGEGPVDGGELSHFGRFLGIFLGGEDRLAFPEAQGAWVPTRDVPTDPGIDDITDPRTRRWAELADLRYALLLGFVEHYLLASAEDRGIFIGWIFVEMRSRLGFIARELTAMPRGGGGVAAVPFTLPSDLHLPADEAARWDVHRRRTQAAIAKVGEMLDGEANAVLKRYLSDLLASDSGRLALMQDLPPQRPIPTSYARDIAPLFRPKDTQHMRFRRVELQTYEGVKERADRILARVSPDASIPMPKPPDPRWTAVQADLFARWIAEGFPP